MFLKANWWVTIWNGVFMPLRKHQQESKTNQKEVPLENEIKNWTFENYILKKMKYCVHHKKKKQSFLLLRRKFKANKQLVWGHQTIVWQERLQGKKRVLLIATCGFSSWISQMIGVSGSAKSTHLSYLGSVVLTPGETVRIFTSWAMRAILCHLGWKVMPRCLNGMLNQGLVCSMHSMKYGL